MKDDFDDIKHILRQAPAPKIDPAAKKAAISLALAEFEKNNPQVAQGSAKPNRLKITANNAGLSFFGRRFMKTYQVAFIGAFCAFFVLWAFVPVQTLTGGQSLGESKDVFLAGNDQKKMAADQPQQEIVTATKEETKNGPAAVAPALAEKIQAETDKLARNEILAKTEASTADRKSVV